MKKLISLIASLSLVAAMITPVSAASIATNEPVVETTVQEITATEYEQDWVGEPLEDGYKAYLVDVYATGLDLANACAGTTNVLKKKRTGTVLMSAGYELIFESTDNIGVVYTMDGLAGGSSTEKTVNSVFLATKANEGYPTIADGGAATTATDAFIYQFVITTNAPVTGTINSYVKVSELSADTVNATQNYSKAEGNISYKVNGADATTVTFGATVEKDPIEIVGSRYDLADGFAWDVQVNKYQPAKTYKATFTDVTTTETKVNDFDFSQYVEAQADATFGFVALLKTAKTNVTLSVQ